MPLLQFATKHSLTFQFVYINIHFNGGKQWNILKMPLYSQFHQIYSHLKLIKCIFHAIYLKMFIPIYFFLIYYYLYMPLGGKWQTLLLEVIFNSKLCKTYSHLKIISLIFYIITTNFLYIDISYLLYMCKYTCHEIIFHMLTGDIDCVRGLVKGKNNGILF